MAKTKRRKPRRKKVSFWATKTFKKRTRVTFYAKPKKTKTRSSKRKKR